MARAAAAPTPLDAGIVTVRKGEAAPASEPQKLKPLPRVEERIGITVRFPATIHERLRVLAFERRTSKQALIEEWVAAQLAEVQR